LDTLDAFVEFPKFQVIELGKVWILCSLTKVCGITLRDHAVSLSTTIGIILRVVFVIRRSSLSTTSICFNHSL
jgi:hypothetical protein